MSNMTTPKNQNSAEVKQIDLLLLLKKMVRYPSLIALFVLLGGAAGYGISFLFPPTWVTTSRLLPEDDSSSASSLMNLAAMAGIKTSTSGLQANFREIILSPDFLDTVSTMRWRCLECQEPNTIDEIYELEVKFSEKKLPHMTFEEMKKKSIISTLHEAIDFKSMGSYRELTVQARDPYLALDLNLFILEHLQQWVNQKHRSATQEKVFFLEKSLADFEKQLATAEQQALYFQEQNRSIATPALRLKEERYQREIQLNSQLVVAFRKELEMSRVELEKEKPVINIIQYPQLPDWKDSPKRKQFALAGAILGGGAVMLFSLLLSYWRENSEDLRQRWKNG